MFFFALVPNSISHDLFTKMESCFGMFVADSGLMGIIASTRQCMSSIECLLSV